MRTVDKAISIVSALLMLSILMPCSVVEGSPDTWTFMVYMDADNDLETYALKNFLQMSEVGSSTNVKIIVQMDRISTYNSSYGGWSNCRRFNVSQGSTPASAPVQTIGEVNMGNPATLVDFVTWANANYPADHLILIIWDHGSDWEGACFDETSNDYLDLNEISDALSTICANVGRPLDIVGFDACAMASVEVGYQIREYADYYVASEAGTPLLGLAYDRPLWALTNNTSMTTLEFGNQICQGYRDFYLSLTGMAVLGFNQSITLSTVDLGAMEPVVSAFANLTSILSTNIGLWVNHIAVARNLTEGYNLTAAYDVVDLYDLVDNIRTAVPNATVQSLAVEVINAINACVKNQIHENNVFYPLGWGESVENAHGMSVYFPSNFSDYIAAYGSMSPFNFTDDTGWSLFLVTYYIEAAKGNPTVMYVSPEGENISISGSVEVQFSGPMNAVSLTNAFSISPLTAGSLDWNSATETLSFVPTACFAPATSYSVKIDTDAMDLDSDHLQANYSWSFNTAEFNTTISLAGEQGSNGWYVSPVNATLTATDKDATNWTKYRLDSGSWSDYSNLLTIDAEGEVFLEYHSQTAAGYEDPVKNVTLMIDTIAPSSAANITGNEVSILSTDASSGINSTKYRIDGGTWIEYSDSFFVNSSGNHTIEYYSVDKAGNIEQHRTAWVDDSSSQPDFLSSYGLIIAIIIILAIVLIVIAYLFRKRSNGKERPEE